MITINVRTSLVLSEITGNWQFRLSLADDTSFEDFLKELNKIYKDRLTPYIFEKGSKAPASSTMFMVNGRNIRFLNGGKTILKDNDQVTILLPAGGG